MKLCWLGRLLLVPALVIGVLVESDLAEALAALGALLAVLSLETAHRASRVRLELEVEKWHGRWDDTNTSFREWIAGEHRRRAR